MPSEKRPVNVFQNPSIVRAKEIIKNGISHRKTLILIGNCWVDYHGRAGSKLFPGERIVIMKEDGSLLVHRSTGYEPVNWQPPGCIFEANLKENVLEVKAIRRKPAETVVVYFDKLYLVSVLDLEDFGEFALHASEEDMQKAILTEPSLIEPGFKPVTYEKKVEPGFMDIYGIDSQGRFVVVEIKRKTAGKEAVLQLARYVESVKSMVNREVRGILVAPSIAKGVQRLLETLKLEFKALSPKKCAEILSKPEIKKLEEFL